jgi:hypothetical protein
MAISLRKIKFTNYFPTWVTEKFETLLLSRFLIYKQNAITQFKIRTLVSNFSVVITIVSMVTVDYLIGLDTPKLHVPSEFHVIPSEIYIFLIVSRF